jgi:hypothetical protein
MNTADRARRAEELRRAVLDFLAARSAVAFAPEHILDRIIKSNALDFPPEPDELITALTFLENFTPEPLIKFKCALLGSSRFYQATSAGVLASERGAPNP